MAMGGIGGMGEIDGGEGRGSGWGGVSGRETTGVKDERTIASVRSFRTSCGHQVEDDSGDLL